MNTKIFKITATTNFLVSATSKENALFKFYDNGEIGGYNSQYIPPSQVDNIKVVEE